MFDQQESTPWYRSTQALIGTLLIALLAVGSVSLYIYWRRAGKEAHYTELEQQRAQQRAQAATEQPSAPANAAQPSASPAAQAANGQTAIAAGATTAAAHASRNYWT